MIVSYQNVSGLFQAAEAEVRQEINIYLKDRENNVPTMRCEYGVNESDPFDGLFLRTGRDFRYTVNHTKRVCYSFQETKIWHTDRTENDFADPLPILMGYGSAAGTGLWVGDIIGVGDELPEEYELLNELYLDW